MEPFPPPRSSLPVLFPGSGKGEKLLFILIPLPDTSVIQMNAVFGNDTVHYISCTKDTNYLQR